MSEMRLPAQEFLLKEKILPQELEFRAAFSDFHNWLMNWRENDGNSAFRQIREKWIALPDGSKMLRLEAQIDPISAMANSGIAEVARKVAERWMARQIFKTFPFLENEIRPDEDFPGMCVRLGEIVAESEGSEQWESFLSELMRKDPGTSYIVQGDFRPGKDAMEIRLGFAVDSPLLCEEDKSGVLDTVKWLCRRNS